MTSPANKERIRQAEQLLQAGRPLEAESVLRLVLADDPTCTDAYLDLGMALIQTNRPQEASQAYNAVLRLDPNNTAALSNLGEILRLQGRFHDAIACHRRALALQPNLFAAHNNLAIALAGIGDNQAAISHFRRAIELNPAIAYVYVGLSSVLHQTGQIDEAISAVRQALALQPDSADALNNLAICLQKSGQLDEAISALEHAAKAHPEYILADTNRAYAIHFHPQYTAADLYRELRAWNRRYADPLKQFHRAHANAPLPDQRLRVGYVSPNFNWHAESFFVLPLLENHNHRQFEIFCYSSTARPDAITERHKACSDRWRDVARHGDAQLTDLVRADRIDILVDLTMHMADSRLLTFARKPAPVQITWLAYPGGTGMPAMDYRLTDHYLDPPGDTSQSYAENSIRLPNFWCCYDPLSNAPASPPRQPGPIRFGSLNNPVKHGDPSLLLWAKLLASVPDSTLLLLADSETQRHKIRRLFQEAAVPETRLQFVPGQPREIYLRAYDRIDVCLDPLPYNGITTTLDALWMGVPTITLIGPRAAGRAGLGILSTLGLPDLVAQDPDRFIAIAKDLANDLPRLSELRSTLRHRLASSPLMDGNRFARNVEFAYRSVWKKWCQTSRPW